jgi:hypothetical protein
MLITRDIMWIAQVLLWIRGASLDKSADQIFLLDNIVMA